MQEKESIALTDLLMLRILGLSANFLWSVTRELHDALGLGFMKPITMVIIQELKLHVRNIRLNMNTSDLIKVLDEHDMIETSV